MTYDVGLEEAIEVELREDKWGQLLIKTHDVLKEVHHAYAQPSRV